MGVTVSRSYRKPWVKDHNKGMKAFANNVVKQAKNVPNGMAYKKFFDRYSICDYRWYQETDSRYERVNGKWEWVLLPWNRGSCK